MKKWATTLVISGKWKLKPGDIISYPPKRWKWKAPTMPSTEEDQGVSRLDCGQCASMQSLWTTVWHYTLNLNICRPSDPATVLLVIHFIESFACVLQEIFARMCIAPLFVIDPKCKQTKFPLRITCKINYCLLIQWNPIKHWKPVNYSFTQHEFISKT